MAPQYGSLERFGVKVGHFSICAGCALQLKRKKFLQISETQKLLPSGRIKTIRTPAPSEDDWDAQSQYAQAEP
jgi:hypothetical protein